MQIVYLASLNRLVVAQSPKPEARDQYARRHRFWRQSRFLRREENRRKTLGVRLRSTNHSPLTSPGSNPGRSGVGGEDDSPRDDFFSDQVTEIRSILLLFPIRSKWRRQHRYEARVFFLLVNKSGTVGELLQSFSFAGFASENSSKRAR